MRLSTAAERDEAEAVATIQAAHDAGVRWFDTAHAYALDEGELGHNERLLCFSHQAQIGRQLQVEGRRRQPGHGGWPVLLVSP